MNPTKFTVSHRTTTMAIVLVSLLLGFQTFSSMPRREDPEITIRSEANTSSSSPTRP